MKETDVGSVASSPVAGRADRSRVLEQSPIVGAVASAMSIAIAQRFASDGSQRFYSRHETPILFVPALCAALVQTASAQSSVADEGAIRAARARSNRAIAAHDLDAAAAIWAENYVGVSSGNAQSVGRDDERTHFAQLIASRPGVVYVRTPNAVTVNTSWAQAGESGRWSGNWSSAEGVTRVGGIYFAKWIKVNSEWKILAETFVQTSCGGTHYCDAPPP